MVNITMTQLTPKLIKSFYFRTTRYNITYELIITLKSQHVYVIRYDIRRTCMQFSYLANLIVRTYTRANTGILLLSYILLNYIALI